MKILTLEFSSERRSAAVCSDGRVLGIASEIGGRNTRAFTLIQSALREAALEREDIECIAVGLGPGSYTGIRAAISVAQGWQLARHVHLLGISTVECLAAQAESAGMRGEIDIAIDAQRSEFYLARYEISLGSAREIEPLRLAAREEIERIAKDGKLLVSPELASKLPNALTLAPDAAALGRLTASRTDFVPGEKLEPIYLRETAFVKAPPPRVIPNL